MNERIQEILKQQPILLFDGDCGFCNKAVQFFVKREKNKQMHFVPLGSELGMAIRNYFEIEDNIDSMILVKDYGAYIKSCAALRLTFYMKHLWPMLSIFLLVPPFIRNYVYDVIAKRRKQIFGTVENCELMTQEDRKRILTF
jgi:predicted DCC family thiol-disulfide oxidoreductase YuxK